MIIQEIINHNLPILKPSDSVADALNWMEENRIGQLAVGLDDKYLGMVSEDFLHNYDENLLISDLIYQFPDVFLFNEQHIYEALRLISQYQLHILPILDSEHTLIGIAPASAIYSKFAELLNTQELGGILVISMNNRDYSLAEISRLVESNNARILSSYFSGNYSVSNEENSTLTIKLNTESIQPIIATLERYGYSIEGSFAHEPIESIEQERYHMLMKYLSV